MNNKRVGAVVFVIGIVLTFVMVNFMGGLQREAESLGCYQNEGCIKIESNLETAHLAFGAIGFILALGFYLIIFSKGEQQILQRLEEHKKERSDEEKFEIMLKGLDPYEQRVMKTIKEQDGITQNTLQIRTDMSKAKLSYVLADLEKRGLVKRVKKGKTYAVYLK